MAVRDDYRKFNELLDLIQQLCKPMAGMTYEEIMAFMGCSRKTAERTIKFLAERFGDAMVTSPDPANPKQHRFRLEMPDDLPPEYISSGDMVALNAAVNRIKNEEIHRHLESLEYKLNRMLQMRKSIRELNDLEGMILSRTNTAAPFPHIKTDDKVVGMLQYAVMSSTKVNMTYHYRDGRSERHTICPLGFLYGHSNNYLVAYKNSDKKSIRTYIISQLSDIENTDKRFSPGKFDIKEYAMESFGMYHSENGPYDVEWLADADVADAVMRYTFHPTQQFIKNPNGTVTIKMRADGFKEMSWYLFQWSGKIKPIAPVELVSTYNGILKDIILNSQSGK